MRKIIVPVSYMGSGSSAVTDFVKEFENVNNDYGYLEYVFLHCPNGLFDLEDKLLIGNNALRSDEAIHSFLSRMKEFYDKKFWWVGNYKNVIGPEFYQRCIDFTEELIDYKVDYYWYMQELADYKVIFKLIVRRLVKMLTLNKVILKRPVSYSPTVLSYPTEDKFYQAAQKFVYDILDMFDSSGDDLLLDQLLLPHNLFRVDNYFGDELKVIVVERDPRDIFIDNKYNWQKINEAVPYSFDVEEFCVQFRRIHEMERKADSKKILRIKFEDLIYNYEKTEKQIVKFLGYEKRKHKDQKKYFDPAVSIKNTQLFKKKEYQKEAQYIAEHLPEYLYDFSSDK